MPKKQETERFEPELDGQGLVLSPVKQKHLPRKVPNEPALGAALKEALAKKGAGK